jgi:hypothetical protein
MKVETLNELEDMRLQACDNVVISKEKTKCFHDKMLKLQKFEPDQNVHRRKAQVKLDRTI